MTTRRVNRNQLAQLPRLASSLPDRIGLSARIRAKRRAMRALGYEKVFVIGGPKTGTQSLAAALKILGFRHKGWDPRLAELYEAGEYDDMFVTAEEFESFDNGPWNMGDAYRLLDSRFPRSKFILTVREPSGWSLSHERHFSAETGLRRIPSKYWIHDYERKRNVLIEQFEERNRAVSAYFESRTADLLVLDVCGGEEWDRLCSFLGLAAPTVAFPYANQTPT